VRPLNIEVGVLPKTHGLALFSTSALTMCRVAGVN
ncbi:hypothetical protein PSYMO_38006, partial [Pseudomonas amygdali pv. mori str. 301020]